MLHDDPQLSLSCTPGNLLCVFLPGVEEISFLCGVVVIDGSVVRWWWGGLGAHPGVMVINDGGVSQGWLWCRQVARFCTQSAERLPAACPLLYARRWMRC